jgi:hypothetical protein
MLTLLKKVRGLPLMYVGESVTIYRRGSVLCLLGLALTSIVASILHNHMDEEIFISSCIACCMFCLFLAIQVNKANQHFG